MKRMIFTVIYLAIGSNACVEEGACSTVPSSGCSDPTSSRIMVCNDPNACNFYDEPTGECDYTYSEEACLYDDECDDDFSTTSG